MNNNNHHQTAPAAENHAAAAGKPETGEAHKPEIKAEETRHQKDAARAAVISPNKPPLVLVHSFQRVEKAYGHSDLEGIYRLKVGKRKGLDIWIVEGPKIRKELFTGFVYGGHHECYKFIPPGEVWIDNAISVEEFEFTVMHEVTEYFAMKDGGMSYDKAHEIANEEELKARINKTESVDELRERWYKTLSKTAENSHNQHADTAGKAE